MTDDMSHNTAFRELADQNPAVASALGVLRRRGGLYVIGYALSALRCYGPTRTSPMEEMMEVVAPEDHGLEIAHRRGMPLHAPISAVSLLIGGVVALAITCGPSIVRVLVQHWTAILLPTGGVCLGAGIVLLVSRLGTAPLRSIDPPDTGTDDPLQELKDLAERTTSRLRAAYRFQLGAVFCVGAIFAALCVWSMVMVSQERVLYASAFGSGGVAMAILTQWKWQPFDRIHQARRLADNADVLATGLRLRMKTVSEIEDPGERAKAQWEAVAEYTDLARPGSADAPAAD